MIKADHKRLAVWFFNEYLTFIIRRHFHRVEWDRSLELQDRPVLILANHFSWWDGFFLVMLNKLHFRRRFHVMMLEEELRPRRVLRFAGAYSIQKKSRGIIESLKYTESVLQDPRNLVLIFPQGKIESAHTDRLAFEKGVARIVSRCPHVQLLFSIALTDYSSRKKPSLNLYLKDMGIDRKWEHESLEKAFNAHFQDSKAAQIEKMLAEHA